MGSTHNVYKNDTPSGDFIFIHNSFPGTIKIVQLTYPLDDNVATFKLKCDESMIIYINKDISTKLHIFALCTLLMKVDDLRLFERGSTINIT